MRHFSRTFLVVILVCCLLSGLYILIRVFRGRDCTTEKITVSNYSELWRKCKGDGKMEVANYIIANNVFEGKSENDIVSLIGKPDIVYADPLYKWSMGWFIHHRKSGSSMMFPYNEYLFVKITNRGCIDVAIINLD